MTINTVPCPPCQGKGGNGTFGPCGILDMHFKSVCAACGGRGFSAPLGQPPAAVAALPTSVTVQPVGGMMAMPVVAAQAVPMAAAPVQQQAHTLASFLESIRLSVTFHKLRHR
jgi:hypothetical protein